MLLEAANLLQEDIVREVESGAAAKVFDLSLPQLGPYSMDFTRSGRHVALAGRKGHLAVLDWKQARLITELQVGSYILLFIFLCFPVIPTSVIQVAKCSMPLQQPFNSHDSP